MEAYFFLRNEDNLLGIEPQWLPGMEPQPPVVLESDDIFSRQVWREAFENAEPEFVGIAAAQFAIPTLTVVGVAFPPIVNLVAALDGADLGPAIAFTENEVDAAPFG